MPVHFNKKTKPSGELLARVLAERGYRGPSIIWGKATNKREALVTLEAAGVPVPTLSCDWPDYPSVGRPDQHSKGKWFYRTPQEAQATRAARRHPPTHWLRWIEIRREFRIHVCDGKAIRTQEKLPPGPFTEGSRWVHPGNFEHLARLHKLGCKAVKALGWDFGAVDVIWDGTLRPSKLAGQENVMVPNFLVIEVNSAPCLTRGEGTLQCYTNAFMRRCA